MSEYHTAEEVEFACNALEAEILGYVRPAAFGVGVATRSASGHILDVRFPQPNLGEVPFIAAALATAVGYKSGTCSVGMVQDELENFIELIEAVEPCAEVDHLNLAVAKAIRLMLDAPEPHGGQRVIVSAFIQDLADDVVDAVDAYLRLHLLSTRLLPPHGVSMNGIFGKLTNVVWTNHGPFEVDGFELRRAEMISAGLQVNINAIDKFPRMSDYVVPTGIRIADASRVRLGAHLAEGTTVMHEGFCNFNAGTLGASMVEGRISAGVVIGDGTDIGGGASIMGVLSGGGTEIISVGKNCLIGAEGGIGISLGDSCVVEAGCYITAGTRVTAPDGSVVKAKDLSGQSGLLFRRNSQTGVIEALERRGFSSWGGLNEDLHDN